MKIDVSGRVRNVQLPASKPLLPLFESIINSIQAIEDAKEPKGHIEILIVRESGSLFSPTDQHLSEIENFIISDNGIGFDENNFDAFSTSDTTSKADRGGKGIGRFMWLAAFESVAIESVFSSNGLTQRRTFNFSPSGSGIENHLCEEIENETRKTIVKLIGFRNKYAKQCPKRFETIATHIVEEFLEYFLGPSCPEIILKDQNTNETLELNLFYKKVIGAQAEEKKIAISSHDINIIHVRLYSNHIGEHRLYFCAHYRSVIREKISGIPNMAKRLIDSNYKEFVYAVYVNSKILDEAVNAERTGFNLPEDDSDLIANELTMKGIRQNVREHCKEFLSPFTKPIADNKREKVQRFIQSEGVMYRPIIKRLENTIDGIEPEATNDEIDRHLYEAYHRLQVELRDEGRRLLQSSSEECIEFKNFKNQFEEYFERISEINKADLARYVCHRKAIIEFLQKQLSIQKTGDYEQESMIHSIIHPRGKSSDDLNFEDHNLWLVDERLAFHVYLSSDQKIRKSSFLKSDSSKKPDILIFDKAVAFADTQEQPFTSITLIEFKKPLRNEYSEKDNPFSQVYNYVDEIKAGKATNIKGRPFSIQENLPFYCYIICDLTPKLKDWAKQHNFRQTPDALGYFGYNENYNAYCEVISYEKLVGDAKKRNQAFFSKLGLPEQFD